MIESIVGGEHDDRRHSAVQREEHLSSCRVPHFAGHQFVKLWPDEEKNALLGPGQSNGTNQDDKEHNVGCDSEEV